jgi:hypothetical protein
MRFIGFLALAAGLCPAQEQGAKEKAGQQAEPPKVVYPFFRDAETKLMLDYYRAGSGHVPPGLTKSGAIPAALARQLRVTGTLPAALAKKMEPLPAELDKLLMVLPEGYKRGACGTVALLVQDGTLLIVDALELVRR